MKAVFKGGSLDGKVEYMAYTNRLENQIMKYAGPDQNSDGSWPEGSDDMYVPAQIEVYVPTHIQGNEYEYRYVGSR